MILIPAVSDAFPSFSPQSRLWVFIPATPLTVSMEEEVKTALQKFISGWKAHQRPLKADFLLLNSRLLLVAADEHFEEVSGCAMDSLFRLIRELDSRIGSGFLLRSNKLLAVPEPDGSFRILLKAESETIAAKPSFSFKTGISSLPQLKQEAWEAFQEESGLISESFKGLL